MIKVLTLIFLILLLIVGKMKGLKTFICFYINYILIILYIIFISIGLNAVISAIVICLAVCFVSLFMINGNSIKAQMSFISICIVLLIMIIIVQFISRSANIQGFSADAIEGLTMYNLYINCNMTDVIIGVYLLCIIGTIIDTSISISSALNEIYVNNKKITLKDLFNSGMNIGRDILSTTVNTLFFVFLGGIIAFFFWHYRESFGYIINYKALVQEIIELLFCFISSILIIPITSFITSFGLTHIAKNTNNK